MSNIDPELEMITEFAASINPKVAMMAEVAASHGDNLTSYRLMHEELSVPEVVEILAQAPEYKEILPRALGSYTRYGSRMGTAIASFPEFDHRRTIARELSDLLEGKRFDVMEAIENLENPHVQEQLYAVEKGFPELVVFSDGDVNPVVRLAVMNAMYGQHSTTDRLLEESLGSHDMVSALQLAIDGFNPDVYGHIVDEAFGLYAELDEKGNVGIIYPGVKANDVDLTKALRSFANTYQKTKGEHDWFWSMPMFYQSSERYSWDGNSFVDTVRRAEGLFETGRVSFVEKVLSRVNFRRFGREPMDETPKNVLMYAEKLKDAKLPEEIHTALITEFDRMSLVGFARAILQEPVLARIRALDKMGPHLGKAAIGYTATYESPEDVQYVAEHILDVTQLGNSKKIFEFLKQESRNGQGAKRLRAFLPEGIDLRKLSEAGREVVRATGLGGEIEHMDIFHEVLREHQDRLRDMKEFPEGFFPGASSFDSPEEARESYERFLGIQKVESQ